jgi:hypothetical protein
VLPALLTIAKARQEAQLFVAFAEQETASGGGPEPIRWQFGDAHLEPLTRLGTAVSNASRVKLLQVLRREGESTTAALGAASGLAGGNLYQQLNELHAANLLFQPQRGKYRLTPSGRFAVDLHAPECLPGAVFELGADQPFGRACLFDLGDYGGGVLQQRSAKIATVRLELGSLPLPLREMGGRQAPLDLLAGDNSGQDVGNGVGQNGAFFG